MSEEVHTPLEVAEGILSGKYTKVSAYVLVNQIEQLTRERDEARAEVEHLRQARNDALAGGDVLKAEVERQARHIEELQQKVDAEKSCACSYDEPGDVCQAHSPALAKALAEIERLRSIHTGHQPSIGSGKTLLKN